MKWFYHEEDIEKRGKLKQVLIQVMSDSAFFPEWYFKAKDSEGKEKRVPAIQAENLKTEKVFVHGQPGSICGNTHCNGGTDRVCDLMGISYQRRKEMFFARAHNLEKLWKQSEVWIVTSADEIYKQLIRREKEGKMFLLTEEEAHYLTWCGEVIFAIAGIDPNYSPMLKSGHISPLWPTDENEPIIVANIGGYNKIAPIASREAFGVKGLTPIRYYKA